MVNALRPPPGPPPPPPSPNGPVAFAAGGGVGAAAAAADSPRRNPSNKTWGSFHTKRCRGGVERRQLKLKGVEGGY